MKKLILISQCAGRVVESIKCHERWAAINFVDGDAFVIEADEGDAILKPCLRDDHFLFDTEDELGLKTAAELAAEEAKAREERRQKFLKLKAEFEPS